MNLRSARLVVIAALVVGLGPGALVAACGLDDKADCCCPAGGCPTSVPQKLDTVSCCGAAPAVPAPAPTTAAPSGPVPSGHLVAEGLVARIDSGARTYETAACRSGVVPRSPPLYTLHAVFLI